MAIPEAEQLQVSENNFRKAYLRTSLSPAWPSTRFVTLKARGKFCKLSLGACLRKAAKAVAGCERQNSHSVANEAQYMISSLIMEIEGLRIRSGAVCVCDMFTVDLTRLRECLQAMSKVNLEQFLGAATTEMGILCGCVRVSGQC